MLNEQDFLGDWSLARQIDDRAGGQSGQMIGRASFVRADDHVLYREAGQMRLGNGPAMSAERSYIWRFENGVTVQFADGRPFHQFIPSGQVDGTNHPCGDDFYRVKYDFTGWPDWSATWRVTGPRKDYTSITHYTRL